MLSPQARCFVRSTIGLVDGSAFYEVTECEVPRVVMNTAAEINEDSVVPVEGLPEHGRKRRSKPQPTMLPMHERLAWDLDDIAALTGVSSRLLQRLRAAGKLPKPSVKLGRRVLWSAAEIRRWVDSGEAR